MKKNGPLHDHVLFYPYVFNGMRVVRARLVLLLDS